jgi:hypothetical protein
MCAKSGIPGAGRLVFPHIFNDISAFDQLNLLVVLLGMRPTFMPKNESSDLIRAHVIVTKMRKDRAPRQVIPIVFAHTQRLLGS